MEVFLIFLAKIIAFVFSLILVASIDYSNEKDKFDHTMAVYSFWKDYWPYRNDNLVIILIKSFLTGFAGFFMTSEVISYFFPAIENVPIADTGIEILLIIGLTYGSGKIFHKFS